MKLAFQNLVKTPPHLDFLLIMKAILALNFVWITTGGPESAKLWGTLIPLHNNRIPAWLFLMLAGYRMTSQFTRGRSSWDKSGLMRFYLNYALRILPLYLVISLLGVVAAGVLEVPLPTASTFIPKELFLLQWTNNFSLNPYFAVVGLIAQFCLIAPAWCYLVIKPRIGAELASLIYLIGLFFVQYQFTHQQLILNQTDLLSMFIHFHAGVLAALFLPRFRDVPVDFKNVILRVLAVVGVTSWALANWFSQKGPEFYSAKSALVIHLLGLAILGIHNQTQGVFKLGDDQTPMINKSWAPIYSIGQGLMIIGELALGICAWQMMLLKLMPLLFEGDFLTSLLVSLSVAVVTYICVEKPILQLKQRSIDNLSRTPVI